MSKRKWDLTKVIRGYTVYGKKTRAEIIVRVEFINDTTRYAEWSMPKIFGLEAAMDQAALQTKPGDIQP